MRLLIASDHGGFDLKEFLKESLNLPSAKVDDFGAYSYNDGDDFPDFVVPVMVALSNEPNSLAVVICRNGVGVSVLANKYPGVRCALGINVKHVISAREHDDVNVLALPGDYVTKEDALTMVQVFLGTEFPGRERHARRLKKITNLEKEIYKQNLNLEQIMKDIQT